jgi:hypothetical protein
VEGEVVRHTFFVVHNDKIVRGHVEFGDERDSTVHDMATGFAPSVFERVDDASLWSATHTS